MLEDAHAQLQAGLPEPAGQPGRVEGLEGAVAEGGQDPWGNERVGLELTGSIDRREFDLKWNQTLPNGNLLVSNEVKLLLSVSAVKAP